LAVYINRIFTLLFQDPFGKPLFQDPAGPRIPVVATVISGKDLSKVQADEIIRTAAVVTFLLFTAYNIVRRGL